MKIIKIGAVWCPGCLVMRPIWKKIKDKYDVEITEYDLDMNSEDVEKYNVGDKLPVTIFIDDKDNELSRLVGEKSIEELEIEINKYLDKGV